jgi:hypothetical protein
MLNKKFSNKNSLIKSKNQVYSLKSTKISWLYTLLYTLYWFRYLTNPSYSSIKYKKLISTQKKIIIKPQNDKSILNNKLAIYYHEDMEKYYQNIYDINENTLKRKNIITKVLKQNCFVKTRKSFINNLSFINKIKLFLRIKNKNKIRNKIKIIKLKTAKKVKLEKKLTRKEKKKKRRAYFFKKIIKRKKKFLNNKLKITKSFIKKKKFLKILKKSFKNKSTFSHKINITVTANNLFCNLSPFYKQGIIINSCSSEKYKIKLSKSKMKFYFIFILEKFFEEIFNIKKIFKFNGVVIKIISPIKIRKKIIKLIWKKFKSYSIPILFNIERKKIFNGCRPPKKIRRKRRRFQIFK